MCNCNKLIIQSVDSNWEKSFCERKLRVIFLGVIGLWVVSVVNTLCNFSHFSKKICSRSGDVSKIGRTPLSNLCVILSILLSYKYNLSRIYVIFQQFSVIRIVNLIFFQLISKMRTIFDIIRSWSNNFKTSIVILIFVCIRTRYILYLFN